MMFAYEKTSNKKWPFRVTAIEYIELPELSIPEDIHTEYFSIIPNKNRKGSRMWIAPGYAWDGCSGPVPTTKRSARASAVHDVLYQCMREGFLGQDYRVIADQIFYRLLIEDNMPVWIAKGYYGAVRIFGVSHCVCIIKPSPAANTVARI